MFASHGRRNGKSHLSALTFLTAISLAGTAPAEVDQSLYMSPLEVKPGMKGFGRTVLSGTNIETFNLEVISVMHNAFYAKQAVILIRCSGLNLEHSGIIGGMSGSPCYIRDDQGRERMIGAVAYGWTFNKDPICGVQPITQMLEVAEVRKPKVESRPAGGSKPATGVAETGRSGGLTLEEWLARSAPEPIPAGSRLAVLNGADSPGPLKSHDVSALPEGLRPIETPIMVSCRTRESMGYLEKRLRRHGLTPLAAGGSAVRGNIDPDSVRLEPGSALCVSLMTGDMTMEGVGTCTTVIGDKILGFGHAMFGEGSIELPMATGYIHTVIPSVARSSKLGGSLKIVGTLWGDEATAVSGVVGKAPAMVPLEVVVNDVRGRQTYRYEVAHEETMTAMLLGSALMESVYAHNAPPRDHTIRHSVEIDFGDLGTYKASNVTAQEGFRDPMSDLEYPVQMLLNPPLAQKAKARRARVEITIEDTARSATINNVSLLKTVYKPGETVTAVVQWAHYREEPLYTYESYTLALPDDIPDGDYDLTICSVAGHLSSLRTEKPHLFRAETLSDALTALNLLGSLSGDQLYMRLGLKRGGLAYKRIEMPDLPASRRKILSDTKLLADLTAYTEAMVVEHKTGFVTGGRQTIQIQVKRRPDP